MWICLDRAFLSVVQDRQFPEGLCVGARRATHLEQVFPSREIITTPDADYAYRVSVTKTELTKLLHKEVHRITYDSFKNAIRAPDLRDLYGSFWIDHRAYQEEFRR